MRRLPDGAGASDGVQSAWQRQVDGRDVAGPAPVAGVIDVHSVQVGAAVERALRIQVVAANELGLVVDAGLETRKAHGGVRIAVGRGDPEQVVLALGDLAGAKRALLDGVGHQVDRVYAAPS